MPSLPPPVAAVLIPFAALFSRRVWAHAQVLLAGHSSPPHSAPWRLPCA